MSELQGQTATTNAPHNHGAQPGAPDAEAFNFELPTNAHPAPQLPENDTIVPATHTKTTATTPADKGSRSQGPPTRAPATHPAAIPTNTSTNTRTIPQGQATHAPVTQTPGIGNPPTSTTTPPAAAPASVSFSEKLDGSDRGWKVKALLRILCVNLALVGIGTIAWSCYSLAAHGGYAPASNDYIDYFSDIFDGPDMAWPGLITFCVSVAWCLACLAILAIRKRPMHPGACVALDLLLWLSYCVTATWVVFAVLQLESWGPGNGFWDDSGSSNSYWSGEYILASNGTIVWDAGTSPSGTPVRDCDQPNSNEYAGNHRFADCAELDAFVNKLWQEKPHRVSVLTAGLACQFLCLVFHFILFVWACVDTHRYNNRKVGKDAEKLAAGIVQTMIVNGAIVPPSGQMYMRPGPGEGQYYQLPNQHAYPMMPMNAQHMPGQHMPGQVPVAHGGYYHPGHSAPPGPSGVSQQVPMVQKTSTRYT